MEEPNEELRVIPELYFLIAKFLSGGPLKETAKTLLKELERVEVLPRRLDWEGAEHSQSFQELESRYSDLSWDRLAAVCARALRLARELPPQLPPAGPPLPPVPHLPPVPQSSPAQGGRLAARLSLLSEALVRPKPQYSTYKPDHTLVRRLVSRELGSGPASAPGGQGGQSTFSARMLSGLTLQRRTLGHLSAVYCLVFDCTGRYVVTGADDLLVKVWSALDGRLVCTLRGAAAEITDVCVSRDAALIAAGSVERLVRVWCLRTAAPRAVLHAHAGTITSVQWAPGARGGVRWLASTSTDGSVAFWTCSADGQFLSQPVQYVERMRPGACHMICAAWSSGGGFLAAGSADHHVRLYCLDASSPKRVLEIAVHSDAVDSLAWAHRGLRFVSGSKDGSAAVWTLHATQWRHCMLRCLPLIGGSGEGAGPGAGSGAGGGAKLKVTMVCWDCSDAYVLTAVSDCTVRVWCSRTCVQVRVLSGHRDEAYVLEAHPFLPSVLLSAGHDGQLFVWDAARGEVLAKFHNHIEGQGDGALFDAKWGGACTVAASDSHGHLLLLGLGQGHKLLRKLPTELFFHTDYRPLVRDALGGALDEQTETPPHELPPPFLVDVEGAPHPPELQRLVPGRENMARSQLIPAALAARSRLDLMIEALAGPRTPPGAGEARGVWRGEGVRHTAGSWQRGEPAPICTRPIVPPLSPAHREHIERTSAELNAFEQSWYRREMRRRPLMISTAGEGSGGPRRRPGRRPGAPRARAPARPIAAPRPSPAPAHWTDSSSSSARVSCSSPSSRSTRMRSPRVSSGDSDTSLSYSDSKTEDSSSSSQYSDWEAGAALAPPARARRRPQPTNRYSPSVVTKRSERPPAPLPGPSSAPPLSPPSSPPPPGPPPPRELPEAYRPGEWLCAVSPRKAPYHPQMGDHCLYFRLGHQRYFEAVSEKDVYKLGPRDRPWERGHVYECEAVKVVGIKYVIKPPRVACLRLACELPPPGGAGGSGGGGGGGTGGRRGRFITVRYHDMPDVIDFLVLRQQYEVAMARRWGAGDRFRCMIDDSWWTGAVLERSGQSQQDPVPDTDDPEAASSWASSAASQFLSLRVRWDNGEVERLSPWDLEPCDEARQPTQRGGAVPVLPRELDAVLYRARDDEWPPRGDREGACAAIAQHISQVMSLSVAEPFVAPVDLALYPSYALVVPYPIDLATIRARFENLFYRRLAAAQFDVRYLACNAERFNEAHSPIVRQARLVTDLLLQLMAHWGDHDVLAAYHRLAQEYRSEDEGEGTQARRVRRGSGRGEAAWQQACLSLLRELTSSADAEPFRRPVSADQAPDYHVVVPRPMDLGTVQRRLEGGQYQSREQLAEDIRLVFANSRLYNTNKRSRIYSMTVRLSALFESLWSRIVSAPRGRRGKGGGRKGRRRGKGDDDKRPPRRARRPVRRARLTVAVDSMNGHSSSSSDCETLAATSRRVHASELSERGSERNERSERRADSWDSDEPLHVHRKGKGVGKKSKSSLGQAGPSGGHDRRREGDEPYVPNNGLLSNSESGSEGGEGLVVLEEELQEDVQLTYSTASEGGRQVRKRRRARSSSSPRRRPNRVKRTRERFSLGSSGSSSSSVAGSVGNGRYESDRSYRPRYSTDDDAPLHLYRQRQEAGEEAGPSSSRHESSRSGGVSLRARSPRRYNEDSEEDSAAAISKRGPHHHRRHQLTLRLHSRRMQHARQNAGAGSAHTADHNYYNGHGSGHTAGASGGPGRSDHNDHGATNGLSPAASPPRGTPPPALSISSRGRVRKLTAKARGLLD